jgi:tRNA dimethylallyltransferase
VNAIRLLVVVGPTACGKTRLAVRVAHALRSEIVSADSRQVYRDLDLGTGKDLDEYRVPDPPVPYHLIDIADPVPYYSVFLFQRDCYALLAAKAEQEPFRSGLPLLMVGGTGLYVEAVLRDFRIANVPEDVELRERLMRRPHQELIDELRDRDSELHARTDLHSKKRVARAIEIAEYARHHPVPYSEPCPVRIDAAVFGVDVPRHELHRRIDQRLDSRLEQGMIDEVRGLLEAGVPPARMEQLGLEYREIGAYLLGHKSRQRMVDDLRQGIHKLAKRQRTWFRGLPRRGIPVTWIAPGETETILQHPWCGDWRSG